MSASNQKLSPDEQLYQSNKQEPEVNKVYETEEEKTADRIRSSRPEHTEAAADVEEMSEESFPTSDPPTSTASIPEPKAGESSNQ
jgi:hypothetical protein